MERSTRQRLILIVSLFIVIFAADQSSKLWARSTLRGSPGITLLDGFFDFRYYENRGIAFSIGTNLPGSRYIFMVLGIIVLVVVGRMLWGVTCRRKTADIAFGLIAGGAIGNIADRIYLGRVVDFIVMHWHEHAWPAYNVADAALCVGVGLAILALRVEPVPESKEHQKG